ncbi:MAG: AMP-binding protein, partial [Acidobacteria bacterium]|nr:AMP-binding protein [Acidobacteriota bacterium]
MKNQGISYVCGTSDKPLLGITIGDLFDKTVAQFPDNEAIISRHQNLRLTYRALQQQVHQCARGLIKLGLQKGERVGIWSPNCAEWTITQFATCKLGIILVNLNPNYRTHELEYALKQSGCRAVIVSAPFKTSNYPAMIAEVSPHLPDLQFIISLGAERFHDFQTWDELLALGNDVSDDEITARQRELQFDEAINIQYTSGTTGRPKGATLSHHNILNNGYFVAQLMRFTNQDRLVIPVPLYHCFGMVMANLGCVTHGATMIYPSPIFDPQAVLEAVQAERATALYGVPTMFIAELSHPDFSKYDLTSLRTGIMAGAPCPIEVMKKVNSLMNMREVEICYGMTETSPVSFQTRADAPFDKRVSTVGQIHPHVEVKIIDPHTNQIVPLGEKGELCTRGYSVMLGYWNNEDATRTSIDAARWMHTGDLAVMDGEGYVNIVGRIKDLIIRGGEN